MVIKRRVHYVNADSHPLENSNFLANRIGFWAVVKEQNSLNNTVTVVSDTGYEYSSIPVVSDEWVTVDDNKNYIPSTRNLPPVNSRVFVLTPTYSASGAFVLCSGFSRGDENIRTLWAKDESELEQKNNSRETKTQGGWDITEDYKNGNFSAVSVDEKISITANTAANNQLSQTKEVSVTAWGNTIIINEDGITITDANKKKIITSSSGVSIKDDNTDIIKYDASSSPKKVTILGHLEVSA